jgi:hypothetical protein
MQRTIIFYLYELPKIGKFIESENTMEGTGAGRGKNEELFLMGTELLFGMMKKF